AEGDCYRCVPPDPGLAAAALGASESVLPGTALAEALHTFTLDSGASRCFFRDSTTLTPLPAPVPVQLADPSRGPLVARSSIVLLCLAVPSGSLSGLHLPSFSTNLVSTAALQDAMVTTTTPGGQRVAICTCTRTSPHLATFTRWPGSSLYTLATMPPQVAASAQVSVSAQGRERYFLLVVDDYTRYTTVFPLRSKGQVVDVLIPWIRAVRLQLRELFQQDLPVLRLHSDRGGEFSSDLLQDFCRGEGILQSFTLLDSPQHNGIAESRIGLLMEFYHPTSRHVLPSQDVTFDESVPFYRLFPYSSAPSPPPPLFLAPGPPPVDPLPPQGAAPSVDSQVDPPLATVPGEVAVDSGAARGTASGGAEPGGGETGGAETGGAGPGGAETGGAETGGAESGGAEPRGTPSSGGPAGVLPWPEPLSPQQLREWLTWHARLRSGAPGAGDSAAGDAGAGGATGAGVSAGARGPGSVGPTGPGGARTGGTGAAGADGEGGAGVGAGGTVGVGAGGAGSGAAGGTRATGAGGTTDVGVGTIDLEVLGLPSSTGLPPPFSCPPPDQSQPLLQPAAPLLAPAPYTEQTGGLTKRRDPESRPALHVRTGRRVPRPRFPFVPSTHAMALRPSSIPLRVPLPPPPESSLPTIPDPESDHACAASPSVSRLLANVVTDTSFESTAASALVAELVDFAAACCLDYATALVAESASANPPSVRGECALGTDVLENRQEDFESLAAAVPRFASMLLAPEGDLDAPDIPTSCSYAEAITGPYSSKWQAAMDAEIASWKSTGTYVDEVPLSRANIVDDMWIFRVKRPPVSSPAFKARYVARGFSEQQGVDYFHTFSPTQKMTTLWVLLHVATQRDYELHSLDFSTALRQPDYGLGQAPREWHDTPRTTLVALGFTPSTADPSLFLRTDTSLPPFYVLMYVDDLVFATADTEALTLVKSELQNRHTCTDLGELRSYLGLQITQDRARRTITLTQSHMVHQVLQRFGFQLSSPQPTPLSSSHSLLAPPSDESVELSGPYLELVGCLITLGMGLVLGGRGPVVLTGHADASWVDDSATQRSSQGYTFSLGSGSVSWRSTRSSSVIALHPSGSSTNSHVSFSSMLFSSLSIAFFHSSASLLSKASLRVAGSPGISTGEKNVKQNSSYSLSSSSPTIIATPAKADLAGFPGAS
ncbi:unnamed protein product, partial [Closterium sp. NIES-53]